MFVLGAHFSRLNHQAATVAEAEAAEIRSHRELSACCDCQPLRKPCRAFETVADLQQALAERGVRGPLRVCAAVASLCVTRCAVFARSCT